jgi:threonine/homoserine/homoserine lactone efflux protein
MSQLAAFVAVAILVIVTPGPDTALTIRHTLLGGRRGGIFTAVGVAGGQATWTVATAIGIASLLAASEQVAGWVRLAGAAYLVFLGVRALAVPAGRESFGGAVARLAPQAAFRQGLVSNLTNPKMAAFFPALLPQFAPEGESAFVVLLGLGLLFSSLTLAWLTAYAFAVAKAGAVLRRPRIRRALEAATGAVLIALGLRLAQHGR